MASLSLFSWKGTDLISPKRPSSPKAMVLLGRGLFFIELMMARAIPRSAPGSVRLYPAVTLTKTSLFPSGNLKCLVRTAQISWSLLMLIPLATLLGMAKFEETTRACISTVSGLVPSIIRQRDDPGAFFTLPSNMNLLGSLTSSSPLPVIWKIPVSSVGPKRFLTLLSKRKLCCLSPESSKTESTMCSRSFGPAMEPCLVTWPTMMTGVWVSLAILIIRLAQSFIWEGEPGEVGFRSV